MLIKPYYSFAALAFSALVIWYLLPECWVKELPWNWVKKSQTMKKLRKKQEESIVWASTERSFFLNIFPLCFSGWGSLSGRLRGLVYFNWNLLHCHWKFVVWSCSCFVALLPVWVWVSAGAPERVGTTVLLCVLQPGHFSSHIVTVCGMINFICNYFCRAGKFNCLHKEMGGIDLGEMGPRKG